MFGGAAGKGRCKGDYGRLFCTRVCTRAGRPGWGLPGTPEPGTLSALTGAQRRAQGTPGHGSGGPGTALGTWLFSLGHAAEGGLQPHRGGIAVGRLGTVGCCPCLGPSVPQFPPAVSGGNAARDSGGWLQGHRPCRVHQMVVNHTLLWQRASWIVPLLQELARAIPWRAVGEQLPAGAFGFGGGSDSRQGSGGTSSAARSERSPGFALLPRSPSDAFPGFLCEPCPASPPGWVWEGPGRRGQGGEWAPLPAGLPGLSFPLR